MVKSFKKSNFFTRIFNWEYWPYQVVYFPVVAYYFFRSIKARSPFYFSGVNPGIESSGLMGESKIDILDKVPDEYKPKTVFVPAKQKVKKSLSSVKDKGIEFPLIVKPNIGERGFLVKKIENEMELEKFFQDNTIDLVVQEFVSFPLEFAIMFYRKPSEVKGRVISVCKKQFLGVTGDGESTIRDLILKNPRAKLKLQELELEHADKMNEVLEPGVHKILVYIGNHIKGTKFLNGNDIIDERLNEVFDKITKNMDGIFFCRYDLKCSSVEDLKEGKNIRIMEVNGVSAEPAHIYDPDYPLSDAYRDLFKQVDIIYEIATENRKRGTKYMNFKEVVQLFRENSSYKKSAVS